MLVYETRLHGHFGAQLLPSLRNDGLVSVSLLALSLFPVLRLDDLLDLLLFVFEHLFIRLALVDSVFQLKDDEDVLVDLREGLLHFP